MPVSVFIAFWFGARTFLVAPVLGQVIEGESEVVNIRDADSRLEPLIFTLVGLGIVTIIGTVLFWWFTRPKRQAS